MRKILIFTMGFGLSLLRSGSVLAEHPFLIVKKSMYLELQEKGERDPWKILKNNALATCKARSYSATASVFNRSLSMRDIMNNCALSYILFASERNFLRNKIVQSIAQWPAIYRDMVPSQWNDSVPSGNSFVLSMVALDIIFDDLTATERNNAILQLTPTQSQWPFNWPSNFYGTQSVWYLFLDKRDKFGVAKEGYRNVFYTSSSAKINREDGSVGGGPGYAFGVYGGDEYRAASATLVMDILTFTGEYNYYNEVPIQKLYRWMALFGRNPFGTFPVFGDTAAFNDTSVDKRFFNARSTSLGHFSSEIASQVAWWRMGRGFSEMDQTHSLFAFILGNETLAEPKQPYSTIFAKSGAAFWEANPDSLSLMGAISSLTGTDDHSHREVNGIYLAGYGEHLLMNSGYPGWGNSVGGYSFWGWFKSARASNVVMIDSVEHQATANNRPLGGNGVSEGLTSALFDYASGDSGVALPNGHHQRNFIFVHPQDGANGYFVLLDEVQGQSGSKTAQLILHPNSDESVTVGDGMEYEWQIRGPFLRNATKRTYLSVFLGSTPQNVALKFGAIADGSSYLNSKYLEAAYSLDSQNRGKMVTALFPHNEAHPKPQAQRVANENSTGIQVSHRDSVKDLILTSKNSDQISYSGIKANGSFVIVRKSSSTLFYFAQSARSFDDGSPIRQGFESSAPISLHLRKGVGQIESPGAQVSFYANEIKSVELDGVMVAPLEQSAHTLRVQIGKGRHSLRIVTGAGGDHRRPLPPTKISIEVRK